MTMQSLTNAQEAALVLLQEVPRTMLELRADLYTMGEDRITIDMGVIASLWRLGLLRSCGAAGWIITDKGRARLRDIEAAS
jgi:hypothetical protein